MTFLNKLGLLIFNLLLVEGVVFAVEGQLQALTILVIPLVISGVCFLWPNKVFKKTPPPIN